MEAEETILLDIVFNIPGIYLDKIKNTSEELTGKSLCREVRRLRLTRQGIYRIVLQRSEIERAAAHHKQVMNTIAPVIDANALDCSGRHCLSTLAARPPLSLCALRAHEFGCLMGQSSKPDYIYVHAHMHALHVVL